MKLYLKILIIILILILIWFVVRFVIGGPEDDWICVDGEWVKHGAPSASMPTTGCGESPTSSQSPPQAGGEVNNFMECTAEGNAIMESYPRQCRDEDGNVYIEDVGNPEDSGEKTDLIQIDNPRPNQKITSPLIIEGQARGYWFFEASFPVVLVDWDGRIIAQGIAQTQSDWMTEEFVPFEAELTFETPDTSVSNRGALILRKDNPSGLPENDDALEIPIEF